MLINFCERIEDLINGQLNKGLNSFLKLFPPIPYLTTPGKKHKQETPAEQNSEPVPKMDFKAVMAKLLVLLMPLFDITKAPVISYINGIKGLNFKTAGIKNILLAIFAFAVAPFTAIKNLLSETKPAALMLYSSVIVGSAVALTMIFVFAKEFYQQSQNSRSIASIHSIDLHRPVYYKMDERHYILYNIVIPFDLEGSPKTMIVDFILTPSNVYIKEFLTEKEIVLQDRLNTYFETVSEEFPLTDEGKEIIKEKVKEEANMVLKEWKIKGSIDEVQIHYLISP